MRIRLGLLAVLLALGGVIALPGAVAAASPYTYLVVKNYCDGDQPNIVIKMFKPAGYYPDKFTMDAVGQHRDVGYTSWWKESSNSHFQALVPNQYAKWTWKEPIFWNPPDSQWHRIKVNLKVWSGGSVIAHKTLYSVKC
jgi:hypothetical protein